MLTVDEALRAVLAHARPLEATRLPLVDALGRTLTEDVTSDIDSPPHDKAMVDGYAVRNADLASGAAELEVLEEVTAGRVPTKHVGPGQATRIMTGSPIPSGAEAVVMIERTELLESEGERVRIADKAFRPGQHVMRQGTSFRRGEMLLPAGTVLQPAAIGLLAEVGVAEAPVTRQVEVALLATGDELVPADHAPGPGQIRNSNGPLLVAGVQRAGARARDLGIAADREDELRRLIGEGLAADVLVLSGGVSAGVLDLVPQVLRELGVEPVFHKVSIKPGKPLWFGVSEQEAGRRTLVFGLPGNPVSSLVCFELFVRPAIERCAGGVGEVKRRWQKATLETSFQQRGDRPLFHPAILDSHDGHCRVSTLAWRGSADLRGMATANALAHFPAGDRLFEAGEVIDVVAL